MKNALLRPHPSSPALALSISCCCQVTRAGVARVGYALRGAIDRIVWPMAMGMPARRDGLWRHTCFEAFFRIEGERAYRELNFAPSGDWAAYRFADYRKAMADDDATGEVALRVEPNDDGRVYWVEFAADWLRDPRPFALALSAVVVERDGATSHWALRHPDGPPDFHHPDCFARTLPAPSGA